ncbi:MAG: mechanosensitive ion channel domain-containing protein [Verrucomicrobiota bacterium]
MTTVGRARWCYWLLASYLFLGALRAQEATPATAEAAAVPQSAGTTPTPSANTVAAPEAAPPATTDDTDDDESDDDLTGSESQTVTKETIENELAKLPEPSGDAPASRNYTTLQSALDQLKTADKWNSDLDKLKASNAKADSLDQELTKAQNEAAEAESKMLPDTIEDAERELKALTPDFQDLKERVEDLTAKISNDPQIRLEQTQRRNEIRGLVRDNMDAAKGDDPENLLARAKIQAWNAEIDYLDLAIATADRRKEVRSKQLEIAQVRLDVLKSLRERLDTKLKTLRQDKLKEQEQATAQAAKSVRQFPVLKELADYNEELLNRRKELNRLLDITTVQKENYHQRADWINQRLDEIKQRVEISGFSQAASAIMLKELRRLPQASELEEEQRRLEQEVRQTQIELFDLSSELDAKKSPVQQMLALGIPLSPEDIEWIKENEGLEELDALLKQSREISRELRDDANRYFEALLSTDTAIIAASRASESFRDYASENILWIPSRNVLSVRDVSSLPGLMGGAMHEFTSMLDTVFKGPVVRSFVLAFGLVVLAIFIRLLGKFMGAEKRVAVDWSNYAHTVRITTFELIVAAIPLLVLHLIAWTLDDPKLNGNLANSIEFAARSISPATFTLMFLYRITRMGGLAEKELRWPANACSTLNRAIARYMFPALLFAFMGSVLDQYSQIIGEQVGARVFLLPAFVFCILAFHKLFSPRKGILAESSSELARDSSSLRWFVYLLMMGWQLFLVALVTGGYMLGSIMLWGLTFRTLWLIAGVLIVKGLAQRYLEIQQWRAKMQQLEEEAEGNETSSADRLTFALDDSSRQVLGFLQWIALILGVSAVWSDAFPSLRKLGAQSLITIGENTIMTIGQGIMLLACAVTTVLLARSLPRLLEIIMIRRIRSIDPGTRHAFSTLVVYLVVMFGVIWASTILRIEWGNVQWLIAAISVGLGFGMQEIFGNLVAGIILLFERPIRVGDVVTVGDTTGKVTRIQMRGTTIQEWDRRELIVPNKEFVTGQLTNWTLSDTLTRLTINVGVAYGSDIGQVKDLLLETIKKDHRVLVDPKPAVFFKGFGDSSLDFVCFAFLGTLDERLGVSSDLQQGIYETLNEANITIPFPQRDIHVVDLPSNFFPTAKGE